MKRAHDEAVAVSVEKPIEAGVGSVSQKAAEYVRRKLKAASTSMLYGTLTRGKRLMDRVDRAYVKKLNRTHERTWIWFCGKIKKDNLGGYMCPMRHVDMTKARWLRQGAQSEHAWNKAVILLNLAGIRGGGEGCLEYPPQWYSGRRV